MTFENMGSGPLDYAPCTYGGSRLTFRGPARALERDYIAFLGGTETYGKFIADPFPALVEQTLGLACVNFGQMNAGVDVFLNDPAVLNTAVDARLAVIQVTGANNLSNRFYAVHPRRNDRFLKASAMMKSVFRDIDFTEFHFTRHMLGALAVRAPDRFRLVIEELQHAWLARMGLLLSRFEGRAVLLWFADHAPEDKTDIAQTRNDPFAVERWMIERLRSGAAGVIEAVASPKALARGTRGMVFSDLEAPAAQGMLGPAAHAEAAEEVASQLAGLLETHRNQ
ncbi:DUF6473 family protein [Marimonas arenosa]|uniref:DUF6473 family protein n=1 Tax=Marimonas arenosa TaxID=1795305 RepID=A0AAE3WF28_9RHOB|nr:DUF6473 family protein [Marimonas arenosa]MDQ2091200.1 DUF6473 family protein [Marimonas arenosa]